MTILTSTPRQKIEQALQRLRWADDELRAMSEAGVAGDLDRSERHFSRVLVDVNVAFDAISEASTSIDSGITRRRIREERKRDALLFYFWHARNVDVHHLIRREISQCGISYRVVDNSKCSHLIADASSESEAWNRIVLAAFDALSPQELIQKLVVRSYPTQEKLAMLGLASETEYASLGLHPFDYKNDRDQLIRVASPDTHIGRGVANSAEHTSRLVIDYYRAAAMSIEAAAKA